MADMRRIDELMSHYKPDSQLSQINAHAAQEPVQVDPELFDLIKLSTHYSQITEGAFDITYASVGYLYDYPLHIRPTEEQIKAALPAVNWRYLLFDDAHHTIRFAHPGMRIDLGGIGKGYAVDRGIGILQTLGIGHALVTAGGDSRILGDRLGRPWLVAIRHPDDPTKVVTRIPLSDSRDVDLRGLRALLRRGRRPLSPHHRPAHRALGQQGAQRHHHRRRPRRRPTACRRPPSCSDRRSALEIINRMPEYDAVFVLPDGRVLYSNGLRPPAPRPPGAPPPAPPHSDARSRGRRAALIGPRREGYCAAPPWALRSSASTSASAASQSSVSWPGAKAAPLGAQVRALGDHARGVPPAVTCQRGAPARGVAVRGAPRARRAALESDRQASRNRGARRLAMAPPRARQDFARLPAHSRKPALSNFTCSDETPPHC